MNEQPPAKSPENENQTAQLLRELHDLLRERNRPRPWYTREPFKSMLAHGTTVCIAIVLGAMIHHCTGETVVTIEAKHDVDQSMSRATAASAPPEVTTATSNAVVITEDPETVTTSAPVAKPSPPRTVHTWIVTTPATAVAMAPNKKAPPPATPVAIPAPQESVRTASPPMLDSK